MKAVAQVSDPLSIQEQIESCTQAAFLTVAGAAGSSSGHQGPDRGLLIAISAAFLLTLLSCVSAGHDHPDSAPDLPEGGRPRHNKGGDPRGGAHGGHGRDRPRRDGAAQGPDPVVQGSEPHPDSGASSAATSGGQL